MTSLPNREGRYTRISRREPGRRIFFGGSSDRVEACSGRWTGAATGSGAATGAAVGADARPMAASKKARCAAVRAGGWVGVAAGCQWVGRISAMLRGFGGYG